MYNMIFLQLLRLSQHYEASLSQVEPYVVQSLKLADVDTKRACLENLNEINKKTMNNCSLVLDKIKEQAIKADEAGRIGCKIQRTKW